MLSADSVELRRRLGPTAWVVFEQLLLESTGPVTLCRGVGVGPVVGGPARSGERHRGSRPDPSPSGRPRRRLPVADRDRCLRDRHLHAHDPDLDHRRRPHPPPPPTSPSTTPTATPAPRPHASSATTTQLALPLDPLTTPPTMNTYPDYQHTPTTTDRCPRVLGSAHVAGDDPVRVDRGGDGAVLHAVSDRKPTANSPDGGPADKPTCSALSGEVTTDALRGVVGGP